MKRLLVFVLLFFIFTTPLVSAVYPKPAGYVNDFANVISPNAQSALEKKLSDYDKNTTNQIAVVTIETTGEETIEEYSINLAEEWKIGQKNKDNGLLMLFAINDRSMRIEVGRGLEGDVTDLEAKYILREIEPFFKKGDYDGGINKGTASVIASIETTYKPPDAKNDAVDWDTIITFIVIILVIYSIAYSPYTPLGGQGVWGTPTIWGRFPGGGKHDGPFGGFGGGTFSGGGSSHKW